MQPVLSCQELVQLSDCDADARLSYAAIFNYFMDIATLHARELHIGLAELSPRHLFWLTVRTRIRVVRRPGLLEPITVTTWPEKAGKLRCNRDYRLTDARGIAAEGKTEWAVINTETGRLTPAGEIYPPELTQCLTEETVWSEPFSRIREDFSGEELWAEYTVRSTDIDLGGHMNNAAYPRMVLGAIPNAELRELDLRELEFSYRNPCFEGERLTLRRRKTPEGWEIGVFGPDGRTMLLGKLS